MARADRQQSFEKIVLSPNDAVLIKALRGPAQEKLVIVPGRISECRYLTADLF